MNSEQQRKRLLIAVGVMVALAVVLAAAMIVLSNNNANSSSGIDYSKIQQSRTKDGAFVLGNPEAPVTIVEFADYRCPHCQEYKDTIDRFIRDFVTTGKAKYEYRMFPTVDGTTNGYMSRIAECTDILKPGSFWTASATIYSVLTTNGNDGEKASRGVAEKLGVDYAKLLNCAQTATQVDTDAAFGQSLGVQGTPAVLVRHGDGEPQWVGGQTRGSLSYDQLAVVALTG